MEHRLALLDGLVCRLSSSCSRSQLAWRARPVRTITRGNAAWRPRSVCATAICRPRSNRSNPMTPAEERLSRTKATSVRRRRSAERGVRPMRNRRLSSAAAVEHPSSSPPPSRLCRRRHWWHATSPRLSVSRALACLLSEFKSAVVLSLPKGAKIASAVAARLAPVVVASRSFDIRLTLSLSVPEGTTMVHVPLYVDDIGFADGQAGKSAFRPRRCCRSRLPGTARAQRLAGILLTRARSAIG